MEARKSLAETRIPGYAEIARKNASKIKGRESTICEGFLAILP